MILHETDAIVCHLSLTRILSTPMTPNWYPHDERGGTLRPRTITVSIPVTETRTMNLIILDVTPPTIIAIIIILRLRLITTTPLILATPPIITRRIQRIITSENTTLTHHHRHLLMAILLIQLGCIARITITILRLGVDVGGPREGVTSPGVPRQRRKRGGKRRRRRGGEGGRGR